MDNHPSLHCADTCAVFFHPLASTSTPQWEMPRGLQQSLTRTTNYRSVRQVLPKVFPHQLQVSGELSYRNLTSLSLPMSTWAIVGSGTSDTLNFNYHRHTHHITECEERYTSHSLTAFLRVEQEFRTAASR
jgi:hypothetical protein